MAASFGLVYFPSTFLHPSNSYTHQFLCPASPFPLSTSNVLSQRSQRPKRSNFYRFHVAESQMVQDNDDDDSSDSRLLAQNGTGVEIERVINCKVEADDVKKHNNAGDGFQLQVHRRDILHCFGAIVTMDLIARSTSFIQVANAADLIQRSQRSEFQSAIKGTLAKSLKENPDLVPSVLTLALNDAITYDKATKSGGPNGSIRLSLEISRPENSGHAAALRLLDQLKEEIDSYSKGGPISYADLVQLAAQSAVKSTFIASAIRKCGGNEEKGRLLYTAYGSTGQWGLFDKQFGRSDAQEPDPEGRVPQWEKASVDEMKAKFTSVGLGPRQLAVMSAFLGPNQAATEELLSSDPEVAKWVQKYQRSRETVSQTDYEVDLITTLTKLSSLGQEINYEAYTYPVKKVDFSKLKL